MVAITFSIILKVITWLPFYNVLATFSSMTPWMLSVMLYTIVIIVAKYVLEIGHQYATRQTIVILNGGRVISGISR